MIKNLSEKELGHAFFYALKFNDFEHAYYLLKLGAPVNTSYFISQDTLIYTISNKFIYPRSCGIQNCGKYQEKWNCSLKSTANDPYFGSLFVTKTGLKMSLHSKKSPLLRTLSGI